MTDLGVHGLAVLCDHGALVAVERDARLVERLFVVTQLVVELRHAALEDGAEVARDERSSDSCHRFNPALASFSVFDSTKSTNLYEFDREFSKIQKESERDTRTHCIVWDHPRGKKSASAWRRLRRIQSRNRPTRCCRFPAKEKSKNPSLLSRICAADFNGPVTNQRAVVLLANGKKYTKKKFLSA